jgi:hypothetical protein
MRRLGGVRQEERLAALIVKMRVLIVEECLFDNRKIGKSTGVD